MELIVKVTSPGLQLPLSDLLRLPLGLDVWEVKPDHLILRAAEAQIDRLAHMGYGVGAAARRRRASVDLRHR